MPNRLMGSWFAGLTAAGVVLCAVSLCLLPCAAQQIHRNGFESDIPTWVKGGADAEFVEVAHTRTNEVAHDGQRSEHLRLSAGQGSFIYYQYPIKRAPVSEELSAGVWVKSNRPGVQLLARLVLPYERDPSSLDDRLVTFLRGDIYRQVGTWKQLEISRPVTLAQQQQLLMQNELKRPLNFKDCYIDMLLLNVYTAPGDNDLWIDDLEVGPVQDGGPDQPSDPPASQGAPGALASITRPGNRSAVVEFNGSQLLVNGKRFFIRGVRHTDTPLQVLRNAGFNTVWMDIGTAPEVLHQAADLGFRLVPSVPGATDDPHLVVNDNLAQEISRFSEAGSVLAWDLGGPLTFQQAPQLARVAQLVRAADPGRPVAADVWDGFLPYSRNLNLLGVHRWPLMTALELPQYHDWLEQRRRLANPGTFLWTWIQTHAQDWYTNLVYDRTANEGFKLPVGPQPEQIRLLTYTALGAGCRGLGFWSDRFLSDSHQGRDRLLGVALLNQELEMLEPLLVTSDDPPRWIETSSPDIRAAVLRTAKGILVLPVWSGKGAQYVPGQAAAKKLEVIVPQVPNGTVAYEVTPGDVLSLRTQRVVGGTKVTVPEFGLTTAIVFTSDNSLVVRFQEQAYKLRQLAAQYSYDLAIHELEKVVLVEQDLERQVHTLPDAPQLVGDAQARLKTAKEHWDNHMFADAYHEAQRALRPVRILMRAQWENAIKGLDTPVASPYAVSFYSLAGHWQFMDKVRSLSVGTNVLPGGDFEVRPGQTQQSWVLQDIAVDEVDLRAERVDDSHKPPPAPKPRGVPGKPPGTTAGQTSTSNSSPDATPFSQMALRGKAKKEEPPPPFAPKEGRLCLMLKVEPRDKARPLLALERTYLAINSPPVRLSPGSLVQVSGWVFIPAPIAASADGVMFYDSAGGEPLSLRLVEHNKTWQKFTLYRRVPASGSLSVTLALTGIGTAYFDDVRIEPLVEGAPASSDTVLRPRTP